ncbi:MAG: NAD(P)H-hydrate dehydratase [Phycisphaerales bacterium]
MNPEPVVDSPKLPPRDPAGHKGTFGTVAVVGGCDGADDRRTMIGAPALTALAALRSGAGLVTIVAPRTLLSAVISVCPGATGFGMPLDDAGELDPSGAAEQIDRAAENASVIVLGPGFGPGEAQQQIVARLLGIDGPPIVLDADGLNALAAMREYARGMKAPTILTPHPGEFARLARAFGLRLADDAATSEAARPGAAAELARRLGAIVVLKGAGTIVTDGLRAWRCERGNAALAVGGSGDVLSGVIGGFVAQFARAPHRMSLFDCARLGVLVHALAAERWAERHGTAGLVPEELCGEIPDVLAALRA